jgi:exopolyphosphatase/guanosine-5'-triphosphate,3'-diphosphate pyrophosphatase
VIVPRWEWRAFAEDFGDVDRRFDALAPERTDVSDEIYVVTPAGDASVKVRDGLVDVKLRMAVDADGLEQWKPVVKAPYPIAVADVRLLLDALHVTGGTLGREAYTQDQLVAEVLRPHPELHGVRVHKRRVHYTLGGCMAERSEISTEHGEVRTIAVESEDPARLAATVRELGFDPRRNVSLPRELALLAGA